MRLASPWRPRTGRRDRCRPSRRWSSAPRAARPRARRPGPRRGWRLARNNVVRTWRLPPCECRMPAAAHGPDGATPPFLILPGFPPIINQYYVCRLPEVLQATSFTSYIPGLRPMIDINEIGATAFVIASIRALEPEKPQPLFNDPYAPWFSNDRARTAARQVDAVFPPSTTMVRFRTRYFNRFVERGIVDGARQVVLLGGGFDMRAHHYHDMGVAFFEVDQKAVLEFKRHILADNGLEQPPSLFANYLEEDVAGGLADLGFDLAAPTLMVWEGNTMYLPPASIMPFLNRLAAAIPSFRIAFDYFAVDLQRRDFDSDEDRKRLEGLERAMQASFPTGFPDLTVFEKQAPFEVAESGSFSELAEEYGLGEMVAEYPEDWRETLTLYRYCVLERR
ncbi:MAG: SAM-dependent methyltransferase [Gemmatimonadales bacterium]|nr:SAM-dependent methyltransferase [Gemmatimonadales bacterium]MYG49096.1 SAM-dependent methyltransferase [Gemmatimonadales bacterium]MYK02011.1 SAM-dependent methyltransferase [Candidatus Palauibacter ramosifaciens]